MPASEFEVIFVDDGSPDRTWQRLKRIQRKHDNVRIRRIENSGWPSRPRNLGLEMAQGEYVLFMDHDDELYPRALEAGYAMASRNHADVLNGKETRTDQSKWSLEVYAENLDNAIDRQDLHPLIPTNPHKLFRRSLLMEHGIRFPEGRRVLWEDVFFALDVARHAKVISVLADTPFYHWVRGRRTASSSYTKDWREYWRWVREIVLQTNEKLAGPDLAGQWRLMMLHQYRSRVLAPLGTTLFRAAPEQFQFVRETVSEIVARHIPAELDAYLTPTQLGRAALVRAGRWDLLQKLVAVDAELVGIAKATSVRWVRGKLKITTESRWATLGGRPLAIRYDGDRIVRDLPPDVAEVLPAGAIEMTTALNAARASVGIRSRDTAVTWMLPGRCEQRIDNVGGRPELVVTATAVLNPRTAIFGRPLDETSWDITSRNEFLGAINQRGLRTAIPTRTALRDGHIYIAYRNKSGMLSLDVDQRYRSLTGSARMATELVRSQPARATGWRQLLRRQPREIRFKVPFAGVASFDKSVVEGTVIVGAGAPRPARIVARTSGVWLESSVAEWPGRYPLVLGFAGRHIDSGWDIVVSRDWAVTLAARSKPKSATPASTASRPGP